MKMKKETTSLIKPTTTFHKQNNQIYTKLVIFFILLGLTLFLFSSRSINNNSPPLQVPTPFVASKFEDLETKLSPEFDTQDNTQNDFLLDQGSPSLSTPIESHQDEAKPICDLFKGDWVPNPNGPSYSNNTCKLIEGQQNCMLNGRPDTGYLYWRWKPSECELPKFNPETFLNLMRNKTFAFIGDSISRNHVQSMLCILSQVEEPKVTYRDAQYRSSSWVFPSYNFTLERVWAPFLLKAETFEDDNGNSASDIKLHLDKLEESWTKNYEDYDYVIIGAGQWFLKTAIYHENNQARGCHNCAGKNLTELGFHYAYRKAVNLVLNFITNSPHKPQVYYRTITPSHFENGEWHNGGTCKRVVPYQAGQVNATDADSIMYDVEIQEFDKASQVASEKGVVLKLFDSTQLSLLRPDGHPGPYRDYQPFAKDSNVKVQNDCLHWCLPGPIDTWNELVLEMVMNG